MEPQSTPFNHQISIQNPPQEDNQNSQNVNQPLFIKNYLGTVQCKLCLTIHSNEEAYQAHTLGKRHQNNLLKTQRED